MILSKKGFNLFTKTLAKILEIVLHKLIGLKSNRPIGVGILGTKAIKVLLILFSILPIIKKSLVAQINSNLTTS